jgi:hypothetical protein
VVGEGHRHHFNNVVMGASAAEELSDGSDLPPLRGPCPPVCKCVWVGGCALRRWGGGLLSVSHIGVTPWAAQAKRHIMWVYGRGLQAPRCGHDG